MSIWHFAQSLGVFFVELLHQRIQTARIAKGISQKRMAEILGISQPGYSQIESGKYPNMKVATLERICEILSVTPDYLLEFTDYENGELTRLEHFYMDVVDLIQEYENDELIDERISERLCRKIGGLKLKYDE